MAIYFSNTLSKEPFQFDSVGNHWLQEALSRPQGYPIYHYLQTEEGCGIFTIDGKEYFLPEGHGIQEQPELLSFPYSARNDKILSFVVSMTDMCPVPSSYSRVPYTP